MSRWQEFRRDTGIAMGLRAQSLAKEANAAQYETDFYRLGDSAKGLAVGSTIAWIL